MMKGWNKIVVVFAVLLAAFLCKNLVAGQVGQPSPVDNMKFPYSQGIRNVVMTSGDACPTREEIISKTRTLQMPFIANNGQVDGQVQFYAKTFGGTVFVTKEGAIVYSLPSGRDVLAGASQESGRGHEAGEQRGRGAEEQGGKVVSGWHGQAPLVHAESEFVVAYAYSPLLHADNANCPPDCVLAKSLLAAYLPELQESTGRLVGTRSTVSLRAAYLPGLQEGSDKIVGTRCPASPRFAYLSGLQEGTDKQNLSMPPNSNPGVLPANYHPHSEIQNPKSEAKGIALIEHLVGGKIKGITGETQSVTKVSYFEGNDPAKWKSNISTYEVVDMGEVYDGVGLRLKAYGNNVEKLFCVKPGASPEQIKVQLDGGKSLQVSNDGQLEAETELGTVKFTKPVAYQDIDGKRVEVAVAYSIQGLGIDGMESRGAGEQGGWGELETQNSKLAYGFKVASYDKTKDLIIDPLLASTYLGGSSQDEGYSVSIDAGGNVYVTGLTASTDFPATPGAYQTSNKGGGDAFVSRLSGDLTKLLASTFLGGSGEDAGGSVAIDAGGNVYVTGFTYSTDFPTTPGAYQTSMKGWYDIFVSKLSGDLTKLLASTYVGGSGGEGGQPLVIDAGGNVYVTGYTNSTNFPTTPGAYQTSFKGGTWDVFVSRLSGDLTKLLASTYVGGSNSDEGRSVAIDAGGNVYVTGGTSSTDFPTTLGAYQTSNKGVYDVFVSRLSGDLTKLLASTYVGGSSNDYGNSVSIDAGGNVYVAGQTQSTDFPTTPGTYQTSYKGGAWDVIVSRLSGDLTKLLASTFVGGNDLDAGYSVSIDAGGNVYVAGVTQSTDFPTTPGAYQTSMKGYSDAFVLRLGGDLTKLIASTYVGGSNSRDEGRSVAIDTGGNIYVIGHTNSTDFPTTLGAYQTFNKGGLDVFVSRLDANLSAGDITPPTVVSTSPGSNAVGVALDSVITAVFSEEMDASTINASTFYLNGGVTGTVSYGTVTATFTPYSNLSNSSTYMATITTGVKDLAGNNMVANYTWSFTTVNLCKAESITAAPNRLTLRKGKNGNVTITVTGAGGCMVEGVTVTATINGNGNQLIAVSPDSQKADANGEAVFSINAKDKKGTAVIKFKATGLDEVATVQVKVR